MNHPPLVEVKDVIKRYGNLDALRGVNFHIGQNEIVGLLGDNGAGKSTLVKLLSGINPPTSGEVFSLGKPTTLNCRRDAENIGIETIYQDMAVVGEMEIWRNMFLGREIRNRFGFLKEREMKEITMAELSSGVDISGIDSPDQMVGSLSGGQRQAVAISRAVHFRKSILLLDEPTSALSVRETNKLLEYIDGLRGKGTSAAFVTHNIYHAYGICDRFVVMSHGSVVHNIAKADTSVEHLTQMVINS